MCLPFKRVQVLGQLASLFALTALEADSAGDLQEDGYATGAQVSVGRLVGWPLCRLAVVGWLDRWQFDRWGRFDMAGLVIGGLGWALSVGVWIGSDQLAVVSVWVGW